MALTRLALVFYAPLLLQSFSSEKFPSRWKTVKVTPLFKNGLECDPCNFLSKIIERHFHDSLYDFLNENNLIYSRPSGFRRKPSTETQLETAFIKIIDGLLFNLDKDRVSGMVLVDSRRAFDMVACENIRFSSLFADGDVFAGYRHG